MHAPAWITLATALTALAACGNNPPSLSPGGAPIGTTASGGAAVSPQAVGPGGINSQYNTGADPNMPQRSGGSRGSR